MAFEKRGMWKVPGYSQKFATLADAQKFEASLVKKPVEEPVKEPIEEPVLEEKAGWSPLDMLRGKLEICDDCGEELCVCEEEWNSAEKM